MSFSSEQKKEITDHIYKSACCRRSLLSGILFAKGRVDGKTVLDLEDDAAYVNMGSEWRMPTHDELKELYNNCSWSWTTQNGVSGYKVTGPNSNNIFLPAAGYRDNSNLIYAGSYGYYWSSSLVESYPYDAYALYSYSGFYYWYGCDRCCGQSVRAVVL